MSIQIKFHGRRPTQATPGAAGLDLHAHLEEGYVQHLRPGAAQVISTGTFVEIPAGYVGLITPRSGLAAHHGVTVLNAPGTIDSDYRGELKVLIENRGSSSVSFRDGDRIAQLVVVPRPDIQLVEVSPADFTDTERSDARFGSTGRAAQVQS
ncbi:dUTP diphosphatase [Leucobacter sp. HY1910]